MSGVVETRRIAVQDRQRLYREGAALVLAAEPDLEVVATAATARQLVAATAGEELHVVVLELAVDGWDAGRLVAALRRRHPGLAVVGLLPGDGDTVPAPAHPVGVGRVLSRNAGVVAFLRAVRSLPMASGAVAGVGSGPGRGTDTVAGLDRRRPLLSHREIQVLGEIGAGSTARGVARAMGISLKTVENHKQRIFSKLGVQNQAHAVAVAVRQGLLTPGAAKTA